MRLGATIAFAAITFALISPATLRAEDDALPEPTFDSLRVTEATLPVHVKLVKGLHTVSRQPRVFYATPEPAKLGPPELPEALVAVVRRLGRASRKAHQSFQADGGQSGSLLWFEYADGVPSGFEGWIEAYLWGGDEHGPSPDHPENVYVLERLVVVVSFPRGDAGGEWVKSWLRRFGLPASRWSPERAKVAGRIVGAQDAGRFDDALAALDAAPELESDSGFLCFLRGELGMQKGDYALSERGYRAALELHRTRVSPLTEGTRWACLDGLGADLVLQHKLDAALPVLEKAVALGRAAKHEGWSTALYNLACVHGLKGRWKECHAALSAAIEADPLWKEPAKSDPDLADALKRPEIAKLVE